MDALGAERLDEPLDERLRLLGPRRVDEARPVALAGVCDQRELADDERLAADVEERAVEAAGLVREDPQPRDLGSEAHRRLGRVFVPGTEQHEQPATARAHDVAVDADGRPRDSLHDGAHRPILSDYARPVGVVELRDRDVIARFCRRRPAVHAYALGDLDDFFWPHTRWLAWEGDGGLEQLVLLYDEPDPPVLLALAEPPVDRMGELLEAIEADLPTSVYAHLSPGLVHSLAPRLVAAAPPVAHRKLGLVDPTRLDGHGDGAVPLGPEDLDEVLAFYERAYPGTWFEPRMLETRRYVGIREADGLVCVAGVHVWSPEWRVAALGNVATLPEARGRGLATAACADLCRRLLGDGIDVIALNVRADNTSAIHAYERLGFAHAADYVEVPLSRA
jgi:ribosomal protein S18 acetylase RimI-like enzyme